MRKAGIVRGQARYREWIKDYEAWRASGETQADFCEKRGYSLGTLKGRLKLLRKWIPDGEGSAPSEAGFAQALPEGKMIRQAFVPVHVEREEKKNVPYCEIRFRDAGRLVIEESQGFERLREVLSMSIGARAAKASR